MKKSLIICMLSLFMLAFICLFDSAEANAKMEIPEDALLYNGHYYYFYKGSITWNEAEEACESIGGHLVTFSNEDEEKAIWEYVDKEYTPAWIGLYNAGAVDVIFGTIEDDWKWVTGEKLRYKNWAKFEPDHQSHFIQDTYDMYAAIGKEVDVRYLSNEEIEENNKYFWGDFDQNYSITVEKIKGYICEWDIYEIKPEIKTIELKKGKKKVITYAVYDKAGNVKVKDAVVSFKSSNKKVAKVTKAGKVKAVEKGNCTITLKYKGATAKVKVKVTSKSTKK